VVNVLMADSLVDTQMTGPAGAEIAAVPAMRVGELLVYPRPAVRHTAAGVEPTELVLDLRRWLISLPGSLSVPVECTSAQAAIDAAQAFRAAADNGAIGSYSPAELAKWAAWWCSRRPDAVPLDQPVRGGVR
jgi:hypothetical protein